MKIKELKEIITQETRVAGEIYKGTEDAYWQGRRDLANELLEIIEERRDENIV